MHITVEADYAVRIVHCLCDADGKMDAQKISDATCVSLRFALKILRKLVTAGIAKSFKGAKGGYMLAKNPGEITLREVVELVEGEYRFNRCIDGEYPCNHTPDKKCPYHDVFRQISEMVREKLESHTFGTLREK